MKTKILFFLSFLILILSSCEKEFSIPEKEDNRVLVNEYVFDPLGVVFKIENDIFEESNNLKQIGIRSFRGNFISWFTKKGQYVCWRDKYILPEEGIKYITIYFSNHSYIGFDPLPDIEYPSFIVCDSLWSTYDDFKNMFPLPVNDTVYVKLSNYPNYPK